MSAITTIADLEIEDPGCVHHIREHLASGCPLEPLVEAVAPMPPEERAPLVAAMVAKANTLIAARNEAANDADSGFCSTDTKPPKLKGGRPKSAVKAALQEAADLHKVSLSTARRDLARVTPPAEVIVPKPPKPKAIEDRLADLVPQLSEANRELGEIRKSMDAASQQFKWGQDDVRWKLLADIGKANAQVSTAMMTVGETAERIRKARIDVFTDPRRALGDKVPTRVKAKDPESRIAMAKAEYARQELLAREQDPDREPKPLGLSDPPKTGLKAPERKRVKVVDSETGKLLAEGEPSPLPPATDTANAWADAARVGVGPSDDEGSW